MQTTTELTGTAPVWLVRGIAVTVVIGILALAAPLLWVAVSAGIGLLALTGIGLAGVMALQLLPLGFQRLENRLLQLRKSEARRNPIEQLQNEVTRRAQRLQDFRRALVTVGGQIESIQDMLHDSRQKSPGFVMQRQELALGRLQQFQRLNLDRLTKAHAALEEFKETVNMKGRQWEISLAIGEATRAMDPDAADHLLQDLLTDTALRSVQDRFNTVFAELDVQMHSVDGPTRTLLDPVDHAHMAALNLSPLSKHRSLL